MTHIQLVVHQDALVFLSIHPTKVRRVLGGGWFVCRTSVSARDTAQLVCLPHCSALPFPQGKGSQPPGVGRRACLRAEGGQSSCNISQEAFDATGTLRCPDMWHPPPLQSSSFSFLGGIAEAWAWGRPPAPMLLAPALQICCLQPWLCSYPSSRQGSVQLAQALGKYFPDARLETAYVCFCKMSFFFSKSRSSTSLSCRVDPQHLESPYRAIAPLPAWIFLSFPCIMGVS